MTHANAPSTPEGRRRLAVLIIERGWSARRTAERFQCSPAAAAKWATRYRAGLPMTDVSSRPKRSFLRARRERSDGSSDCGSLGGGVRIGSVITSAFRARRSVGSWPATGCCCLPTPIKHRPADPANPPGPLRGRSRPGELVHVDIKKLGRIPDGGGWRVHGRGSVQDRKAGTTRDRARHRARPHSRLSLSPPCGR